MQGSRSVKPWEEDRWEAGTKTNLEVTEVDTGRGSNHVCLVYATERDTVNLVWAGNEEQAGLELLQEDDPFALESASKKDQDGARGDRRPEASSNLSLAALFGLLDIVGGVETGGFLRRYTAYTTVISTTDLFLDMVRLLRLLRSSRCLLALVTPALGPHLRAGQTTDVTGYFLVARHLSRRQMQVSDLERDYAGNWAKLGGTQISPVNRNGTNLQGNTGKRRDADEGNTF